MTLPTSIRKRDGRLEDFEPDKLARSLFAATEKLGAPDAFLARELADGVLHFVASDAGFDSSTENLNALTVKVVRELGYPALAKVCQEGFEPVSAESHSFPSAVPLPDDPAKVTRDDVFVMVRKAAAAEIANFSLKHVYPRDLVSAHREGLLELLDVETPFEVVGMAMQRSCHPDAWPMFEALRGIRAIAGSFVALDAPEYDLARGAMVPEMQAHEFAETFEKVTGFVGLRGILNLNIAEPPTWANSLSGGPLFSELDQFPEFEQLEQLSEHCLRCAGSTCILWHLSERDFRAEASNRLNRIVDTALARNNVEFVFDRPRQSIVLGPGVCRGRPVALGMVGMNLVRFVEHLGDGPIDQQKFLRKLSSLSRFAQSAGRARYDFLREQGNPRYREGFLLARAVEIVMPIGLAEAVRLVAGPEAERDEITSLACSSVETIRTAIDSHSVRTTETVIDFPLHQDAGFTAFDLDLSIRKQLRQIAMLQEAAGGGFGTIFLNRNAPAIVKQATDSLKVAWRSGVHRLRFVWNGSTNA